MDIDLLRTFIEVYRLRNFGAAAQALHVTQAAVSARIKLLESQLGAQVFDRSKREIKVTPEGYRFLHSADIILSEWRRARQTVGHAGREVDQLSIAGSLRLWDIFLQEHWLHKLRKSHPHLALSVFTHSPDMLMTRLFEGILDVVVTLEPARMELITTTNLQTLDLALVTTQPNLNTRQAILRDDFIWVDWGQSFEVEFREHHADHAAPLIRVSNCGIALDMIKALGGTAFIPLRKAQAKLKSGELFPVSDSPIISRGVYASYLHRNPKNILIESALSVLDIGVRTDPKTLGYKKAK